jgi:uncharacterized protein YigA (DUF484 family)
MSERHPAIERPGQDADNKPAPEDFEAAVVAFLSQQPEFLQRHPDLLQALAPPARFGKGVVDINQFQSRRLQDETTELRQQNRDLLIAARASQQTKAQIHDAALAILQARDFQHFVRIITSELSELLDVEVVTIGVEGGEEWQVGRVNDYGVFLLAEGDVDALLEPGQTVTLLSARPENRDLFGAAATLVHSQALVRLQAANNAPQGLLALGARNSKKFQPGQATDLLSFLGRVIESQLRAWLELPA